MKVTTTNKVCLTLALFVLSAQLPLKAAQPKSPLWLLEGRVSYFRPEEKRLRKIYNEGWVNYQLLIGFVPLKRIDVVGTVNFMQESGKTIGGRNQTKIRIIPLGIEARYNYLSTQCWDLYAGIGPRYYFVNVRTHASDLKGHISRQGWGGIVETGVRWQPHSSFFLDCFIGYSYQKMSTPSFGNNAEGRALRFGGFEAGGGIGFRF